MYALPQPLGYDSSGQPVWDCAPDRFRDAAFSPNPEDRLDAARRSNNPSTLRALARDMDWRVRYEAAANECTPADAVERAASEDSVLQVRMRALAHPRCPLRPQLLAARSEVKAMRLFVAQLPNAAPEVLVAMAIHETDAEVAEVLNRHECVRRSFARPAG